MSKSQKGSAFERDLCRLLSLWWSSEKRDDVFYRTAGSGARATSRRKKGKQTADSAADMMAIHESGKPLTKTCLFEFKRGYSDKSKIAVNKKTGKQSIKKVSGIEALTMLDKLPQHKDPILLEWWRKVERERKQTKRRFSFIIFKRDAKCACIIMAENTFNFLSKRNGIFNGRTLNFHFSLSEKLSSLVFIRLEDFLVWCKPQCFFNIPHRIKRQNKNQIKMI